MKWNSMLLPRAFLSVGILCLSATVSEANAASPFRVGLSISPFADLELAYGVQYKDGAATATNLLQMENLLKSHGANELYARLATDFAYPAAGTNHSLARVIERANTAISAGLPLNVELGLWKHYGDIAGQPQPDFSEYPSIILPGPWQTLTLNQMKVVLRQYGTLVAQQILSTGVTVNIWDLGNEIDFGTAGVSVAPVTGAYESEQGPNWYKAPDGINPVIGTESVASLLNMPEPHRIAWLQNNLWPYEAQLLNAVREGILQVDSSARFSTHISQSTSPTFAVAFYTAMQNWGLPLDELGFSLFPSSHAASSDVLKQFQLTMKAVKNAFNKPIHLSEYAYPNGPMSGAYAAWNNQQKGYVHNAMGQRDLLRDLSSWGAALGLSGIRPWAPDLSYNGGGWEPLSLFKAETPGSLIQVALPALNAIKEGIATPALDGVPAFLEGFENNNFTRNGWYVSGAEIQTVYAIGAYAAKLNLNDYLTKPFPTSGYANIKIEYVRYSPNNTNAEHFKAEWFNGASWVLLEDVAGSFGMVRKSWTLPASAANNPNFHIRFSSVGTDAARASYIDEIKIKGVL